MRLTRKQRGTVRKILCEQTESFAELLKMTGLDPEKDLVGGDFREVQFGEDDVAGWDMSGTQLDGADLSHVRNIEQAIFSAKTKFTGAKLPEGITVEDLIKI